MGKEIFNIINDMSEVLSAAQLRKLQDVLVWRLSEEEKQRYDYSNKEYLDMFLAAKKLEGCSERTIMYYRMALNKMFENPALITFVNCFWKNDELYVSI